jgi:hypothetical protein
VPDDRQPAKAAAFRAQINAPDLTFLIEAHEGPTIAPADAARRFKAFLAQSIPGAVPFAAAGAA